MAYWASGPWTAAEMSLLSTSFTSWNNVINEASGPYYSSVSVPANTAGATEVKRLFSGVNNADCDGLTIRIKDATQAVMTHEIGHTHGLTHSGIADSLPAGTSTTMFSCGNPAAIKIDEAGISAFKYNQNVIANAGFEQSASYWATTAGSWARSSNPYTGLKAAQLNSGAIVTQSMRVVNSKFTLKLRGHYKHNGTNSASYKFEYRTVSYGAGAPTCGNAWVPASIRWDQAPTLGVWIVKSTATLPAVASYTDFSVNAPDSYAGLIGDVKVSMIASNGVTYFDRVGLLNL